VFAGGFFYIYVKKHDHLFTQAFTINARPTKGRALFLRYSVYKETTADDVISTSLMQFFFCQTLRTRILFSFALPIFLLYKREGMNSNETHDPSLTSSSPPMLPRRPRSSFVEEAPVSSLPPSLPPRLVEQPVIPPAVSTSKIEPPSMMSELTRRKQRAIIVDSVPDLHGLVPNPGLDTELDTHDTTLTKETVTAAEKKSIPATSEMPGSFKLPKTSLIPEWYRTGWTSMSSAENPGGTLQSLATHYKRSLDDPLDDMLPSLLYGEWYHNSAALFVTAIVSFTLAKMNAGVGIVILFCLFIGTI
jgi:hypothetical protein